MDLKPENVGRKLGFHNILVVSHWRSSGPQIFPGPRGLEISGLEDGRRHSPPVGAVVLCGMSGLTHRGPPIPGLPTVSFIFPAVLPQAPAGHDPLVGCVRGGSCGLWRTRPL